MRNTFLKIMVGVVSLGLIGVAITIVVKPGAQSEIESLFLQVTQPPTPTGISATEQIIVERAKQYLREHAAEYSLQPDLSDLQVSRVDASPLGDIIRFRQLYQGIPVEHAGITVSLHPDWMEKTQVYNRYEPKLIFQRPSSLAAKISALDAARRAWIAVGARGKLFRHPSPSLVIYPLEKVGEPMAYTLAWHIEISTADPVESWTVYVDAETGQVLFQYNTLQIANPTIAPIGR